MKHRIKKNPDSKHFVTVIFEVSNCESYGEAENTVIESLIELDSGGQIECFQVMESTTLIPPEWD